MKSATQNHDTTYAGMSFKDAVQAVTKAWRKKCGYRLPPPEISYALSTYDEGTWVLRSSETGEIAAIIIDGGVVLAEDLRAEDYVVGSQTEGYLSKEAGP